MVGGRVYWGKGSNKTIVKAWEGAATYFENKSKSDSTAGQTIKLYSYDKNGKCKIFEDYEPN